MFEFVRLSFKTRFGKDREYYKALKKIFGIFPNNIELYKLALIHRSASLFLRDGKPINNERLEFLGDAVIESVVSDYLFIEFPDQNEGFLTRLRSKIVSRTTLNALAIRIGLDKHIIAQAGGSYAHKHIYGDAFEAMMGAIYLDKGYDFVNRLLINEIFRNHIDLAGMTAVETDFKSRLIEWGQKYRKQITFETVPDPQAFPQQPVFITRVLVDGEEMETGTGTSKKEAEQAAAGNTHERLMNSVPEEEPRRETGNHFL